MAYIGFNAKDVPPAENFEVLPRGMYLAVCTESEIKVNGAKTGEYLRLVFEIVDGTHKGRKVFDRLNIRHQNAKAVEIAHATLSQLCHAVNVLELQDSAQLHNLPVILHVGIEKGTNGYQDTNRIYGYEAKENSPTLAPPFEPITSNTKMPPLTPPTWGLAPSPIKDDDIPF